MILLQGFGPVSQPICGGHFLVLERWHLLRSLVHAETSCMVRSEQTRASNDNPPVSLYTSYGSKVAGKWCSQTSPPPSVNDNVQNSLGCPVFQMHLGGAASAQFLLVRVCLRVHMHVRENQVTVCIFDHLSFYFLRQALPLDLDLTSQARLAS